jgi:hypothetical protein
LADKQQVRRQVWLLEFEFYNFSFSDLSSLKVKKKSPKNKLGKNARITLLLTVLCMARCGKSAMIFRRKTKIANCNEFRLGIQPQ